MSSAIKATYLKCSFSIRGYDRPSPLTRKKRRRSVSGSGTFSGIPFTFSFSTTSLPITSACQYRSSTAAFSTTMETRINRFSRARIRMEKLEYYLLQPLRPENWKTQGGTYLVLRKTQGGTYLKIYQRFAQKGYTG